ncbi:hypothetical protein PV325_009431 [Microctonus aethiopoides]|nr:hypothetical protein PV325_009431 [Microctonus aethiopoides]
MVDKFSTILLGFTDTLAIFRKNLPERKGRDMFKLEQLAQDILQINSVRFHDATYDVEILNRLVTTLTTKKSLIENHKSYIALVRKYITLPSLSVLQGYVNSSIIEKLATSGITYDKLVELHLRSVKDVSACWMRLAPDSTQKLYDWTPISISSTCIILRMLVRPLLNTQTEISVAISKTFLPLEEDLGAKFHTVALTLSSLLCVLPPKQRKSKT